MPQRMDAFNAFNVVTYNGRQTQIQYTTPTAQVVRNSQTLADGSVNPDRLKPNNAGFGAVTSAANMRTVRLTFRFSF